MVWIRDLWRGGGVRGVVGWPEQEAGPGGGADRRKLPFLLSSWSGMTGPSVLEDSGSGLVSNSDGCPLPSLLSILIDLEGLRLSFLAHL